MDKDGLRYWRPRQGWQGRVYEGFLVTAGTLTLLAPHGYPQGKTVFLGDPHYDHLYSDQWDGAHEWYSRLCVVYVCALAYLAGVANHAVPSKTVALARLARAVVAILGSFLMIYGIQVVRMGELSNTDHSGWGLWCLVPYTYLAIFN